MPVRSLNFANPTALAATYEELLKIGAEITPYFASLPAGEGSSQKAVVAEAKGFG